MQTYIALVRHGATDWNYDARAQGHVDIPLNVEGRRQAEAVAARLATERWDAIYSSDLSRAYATAQAIASRTGLSVQVDERLRERCMGLAEGTTLLERKLRWPGDAWKSPPGFETDAELAQRGLAVLTEIAERHAGQRVLVVTHGGLIVTCLRSVSDGSVAIGLSRNTGISPATYDGQHFHLAGPHEYQHLLRDGVEYSSEKFRLIAEATRSGLPAIGLGAHEVEEFVANATAVESAWVEDRLVGYLRAFTDRVRTGYVDLLQTHPEYKAVEAVLLERLAERFPGVTFQRIEDRLAQPSA